MEQSGQPYFLLIGSDDRDFSADKLKVSGARYRRKSLYSTPANWERTIEILKDPLLTAVIGKLTSGIFHLIVQPKYADVASRLFEAIAEKPNLIMAHTAVIEGEDDTPETTEDEDDSYGIQNSYYEFLRRNYLVPPGAEDRETVVQLLARSGVSLIPYDTNAEMSTLAGSFIDDHESNLLFRVYVPAGRLYAAEADHLLTLFHDWLTQVGRHSVRQDGYTTASGRVYEFFGGTDLLPQEMSRKFSDFSAFLDLCAEDPEAAEEELSLKGMERVSATGIVTRYGRSVRRLNTDLRHERETRMLSIRHRLESELLDISEGEQVDSNTLNAVVSSLTPHVSTLGPIAPISGASMSNVSPNPSVTINQQVFNGLQGAVIQSVQGTADLGPEAKELLRLVAEHGGDDASALEADVLELEDPDARHAERLGAKARLKGFLGRLGRSVEAASMATLARYLESKLGI